MKNHCELLEYIRHGRTRHLVSLKLLLSHIFAVHIGIYLRRKTPLLHSSVEGLLPLPSVIIKLQVRVNEECHFDRMLLSEALFCQFFTI